jgi:hypothetical protein
MVGEIQGVLPCAAAAVQDRASKPTVLFQSDDFTLWLADVPRWDAEIRRIESTHGVNVCMTECDVKPSAQPSPFMTDEVGSIGSTSLQGQGLTVSSK